MHALFPIYQPKRKLNHSLHVKLLFCSILATLPLLFSPPRCIKRRGREKKAENFARCSIHSGKEGEDLFSAAIGRRLK